jgi:hypothetical protein
MDRPIARTVEDPLGFSQTKRLAEEVRPKTILIVDAAADTITLVERIGRKSFAASTSKAAADNARREYGGP